MHLFKGGGGVRLKETLVHPSKCTPPPHTHTQGACYLITATILLMRPYLITVKLMGFGSAPDLFFLNFYNNFFTVQLI